MNTFSRLSRIAGLTLASALTAALLLSCEEKEPVPVTIDSQPSQIAAEGGSTSFTITAPGTWTAAVQPASDGTAAAWLTIDPASGEAGEHTVTLTAEANTAEEERTATVIVTSGSSSATVSVSQAGAKAQDEPEEPEEPDTPDHTGLVKSVEFSHSEGESSWAYLFNFEYDDLNRVSIVQVVWGMEGGEYYDDYSNKFTYNEDGTAILERDLYEEEGLEILNIVFDTEGKATEMFSAETSTYPDKTSYDMSYNDQGQLIAIKDNIYQSSEMSNIFEWSNGDNVKLIWSDDDVISDDDVTNVPFSAYDNNLKTNIDINWLSSIKSIVYILQPHQILGAVGMLGKRDAHYAIPYAGGIYSYNSPDEITLPEQIYYNGNPEPGDDGYVIYTHTVEYYLPDECITTFDIDSDGLLHSIKYEIPLHEMAITCKCSIETEEGLGQVLIPENELDRKDTKTGISAITTVNVTYY